MVHTPATGPVTVTKLVSLSVCAQTPEPAMPTLNESDVTGVRPGAENVRVKLPPAPVTARPLNVATPDDVVLVLFDSDADDVPVIDAVTTVDESDVLTFPAESTTRTTGWVESAAPIEVPSPGWVWIASPAAAPTVMVNGDDVTDPNPGALKVRVWLVDTNPTSVAAVNVATPEEVFAVVVPPMVPVAEVTVTAVAGCVVTELPPASTTLAAGDPVITPPEVPPVGCVDTFSADPAPTVKVKLLLVTEGYPVAENVNVYEPVGPLIFRSLNVATPPLTVVAVRVPASAGAFCSPDGVGDVARAAVTTTPAGAAAPPDVNVTAGCTANASPTGPPDG